jgi:hypothetical protein
MAFTLPCSLLLAPSHTVDILGTVQPDVTLFKSAGVRMSIFVTARSSAWTLRQEVKDSAPDRPGHGPDLHAAGHATPRPLTLPQL